MFISPLLTTRPFFYSHSPGQIDCIGPLVCHSPSLHHVFFSLFTLTCSSCSFPHSYIFLRHHTLAPSPSLHRPVADSISSNVVYEKAFYFLKPFVFMTLQGPSCIINLSNIAVSLNQSQNMQFGICCTVTLAHNSTNQPIYLMSNKKSNII